MSQTTHPADDGQGESDEREPGSDDAEDFDFDPAVDEPQPAIYEVELPEEGLDNDAVKVLSRLSRHGYTAYLVGGGVRDLLLGRTPKDFDVATSARPQDVRRLFRNCRVIGRRFRLAHVLFSGGKIIEVATFRRDPQQGFSKVAPHLATGYPMVSDFPPVRLVPDAVRTEVDPDADLLIRNDNVFGEPYEDAIRRDFTMNGLFYDHEHGEVIDYVGGMADLERRVLRMIGDPVVRFREDPVRILRAVKFSARADLGIEPEIYDAIVGCRGELERAAKPRILEEILRLLRGHAAHRSFYLAWDLGILAVIIPELAGFLDDQAPEADLTWERLRRLDAWLRSGRKVSDAVMVASLLLGPLLEAMDGARDQARAFDAVMDEVALRISMPRRLKDRIRLSVGSQRRLRSGKLGALPKRDFFADAATLYAIDLEARGRADEVPDWAYEPPEVPESEQPRRRRRRPRRRRRG